MGVWTVGSSAWAALTPTPEEGADRRVPGFWEGDLVVGKGGKSALATLVQRHSRFLIRLGVPEGKKAAGPAGVLFGRVNNLPALMRGSLAWDQGTEMARHAQLTVATDFPVYFARPPPALSGRESRRTRRRSTRRPDILHTTGSLH